MPDDDPAATATYPVPLDEVQGNITPGFKKDYQDFIFLRFPDNVQQVRDWLQALRPHITSADEVAQAREAYRLAHQRATSDDATPQDHQDLDVLVATQPPWVNVAFTYAGLEKLDPDGLESLSDEFKQGLVYRLNIVRIWPGNVSKWKVRDGFTPTERQPGAEAEREAVKDRVADAVVILAANTPAQLDAVRTAQLQLATAWHLAECVTFHGETLKTGRDHLGFVDGISQPEPRDLLKGWPTAKSEQVVAPGEFILGCERESGGAAAPPPFAMNGSYIALLRIHQDIDLFWSAVKAEADRLRDDLQVRPMSEKLLAAKIVGRWQSGALLDVVARDDGQGAPGIDPGIRKGAPTPALTKAYFDGDETGLVCPVSAHVRRAVPRTEEDARFHRIIRRGITFQDGASRGLIFVSYQASLAMGFEHVQRVWLAAMSRIEDGDLDATPALLRPFASLFFRARRRIIETTEALIEYLRETIGLASSGTGDLLNALPMGEAGANHPDSTRTSHFFYLSPKRKNHFAKINIPVHTTVEGGGYFFAPSRTGLAHLAGEGAP